MTIRGGALERAHLVRSIAELLSTDAPTSDLWPRCCSLLAALAQADRVTIALRESGEDRVAFEFIASGEAAVRGDSVDRDVSVPIQFGRMAFGAIGFGGITELDAEHLTLLESCALYVGARLYHENAVADSEAFAKLAFTDALTSIANRRSFDARFAAEWSRTMRDGVPLCVLMIDLDYFKSYNDGYGHQAGDVCLQRIAPALVACTKRPTDFVARYGGEEFVVLLPGTSAEGAASMAEAMRAAVATMKIPHDGSTLGYMTLSVGVAGEIPVAGASPDGLLRAADDALYRAKLGGRNRVHAPGHESHGDAARPRRIASANTLPVALSRLIGRRHEIAEARGLLAHHRLLSIVGTGGTGKTRTAIVVAAESADRFEDGVRFVDLSPIADPMLIASTIAAAFDARAPLDESAAETLATALETKQALLLLDNCEHLIGAVAKLVSALLKRCRNLTVLATSREPLGITGEAIYRLPLLSMPPPDKHPVASQAIAYDAIALFVERASEANREFSLTDGNVTQVVATCRAVDGIALAIELAASRAGAIGLGQLARRLHEFRHSGSGDPTAVPRQQTIAAMIGWSYDLLSTVERALFRRLGVFAGSFTVDAATAVCATEPVPGRDIFELLYGLAGKSLAIDDPDGEGRLRLLESIRAFARDRTQETGEAPMLGRRHAEYYALVAQQAASTYGRQRSNEWLAAFAPDIDNFRTALEWALDDRNDVALGATLAADTTFFFNDCMPGEAALWVRKALDAMPQDESMRALEARLNYGLLVTSRNLPAAALRAAGERAVHVYRELGDERGLAEALRGLAQNIGWYFREDRALADALACESIDIARTLDDPLQLAMSLRTRGLTIDISDFPQKRAVLEESLALMRAHGNDRLVGSILTWISELEFSAGDEARALEYGREAVLFGERSGSKELYAGANANLAQYAAASGDWETARVAAAQTLRVTGSTPEAEHTTFAIQAVALVASGVGKGETAARLIGFCDARVGVVHPPRQADQSDDILYRRLMQRLRDSLDPAMLERAMRAGASMNKDDAVTLALSV
jgi:diguanylate cyclase (GGDEF)-like protein